MESAPQPESGRKTFEQIMQEWVGLTKYLKVDQFKKSEWIKRFEAALEKFKLIPGNEVNVVSAEEGDVIMKDKDFEAIVKEGIAEGFLYLSHSDAIENKQTGLFHVEVKYHYD